MMCLCFDIAIVCVVVFACVCVFRFIFVQKYKSVVRMPCQLGTKMTQQFYTTYICSYSYRNGMDYVGKAIV